MQTFLPYPDFKKSLWSLDYRRLGKQRVEAFQILNTLEGRSSGWKNHPAVRMWAGYETALALYMNCSIDEWVARGYRNTMQKVQIPIKDFPIPPWFGNEDFHRSHRANLVKKNPAFYTHLFGDLPWEPYVWPTT